MERSEVLDVVRELAVRRLAVAADDVREDAGFATDLQADSLAVVELAVDLEEALDLPLLEDDAVWTAVGTGGSVGALVDVLHARLLGRAPVPASPGGSAGPG